MCLECGPTTIHPRGNGQWRCANPVNQRSKLYKQAYRKSKKEMLGTHCEICNSQSRLVWDHDHNTTLFRGNCVAIVILPLVFLSDNPELCLKAAAYLRKIR